MRSQWDKKIVQTLLACEVLNSNLLLLRQTVNNDDVAGPGTREILLKRCFFRYQGKFYVYTSSVPSQVLERPEADVREDLHQLTVIFQLQVFWRTKTDVYLNQIQ